jgi:Flp pilus assembly protein TadG
VRDLGNFLIRLLRSNEGTAVILFALALTGLLGSVALVTDVGLLYSHRAQLVNAADAAALAGAQELPANPDTACEVARQYLVANGVAADQAEIEVSSDNRSLTVRTYSRVELLFARVLGIAEKDVNAAATAAVVPLSAVSGAVPFGIEEQELIYGEEYVLKEGAGNGGAERGEDGRYHGWYGALDLDEYQGGGARDYEERVKYGYEGMLHVGDVVFIEPGNMSGPTTRGIKYRINQCQQGCSFDDFSRDCPRLVIVPVIRIVEWRGNHPWCAQIRGFAAFFLEGVEGQGRDNNVIGRFVRTVCPGEVGAGGDFGVYTVRLTH